MDIDTRKRVQWFWFDKKERERERAYMGPGNR